MRMSETAKAVCSAVGFAIAMFIVDAAQAADPGATRVVIVGANESLSVSCVPGAVMKSARSGDTVLVACAVPQSRGPIGGTRPAPTATPIPIVWPVESSAPVSPVVSPIVSPLPTPAP